MKTIFHYEPKTSYPAITPELETQLKYRARQTVDNPEYNEAVNFIDEKIKKFDHEDKKAIRNRDFYFRCEWAVLTLTATATVLNVIGAYSKNDILTSIVGIIAATAKASVTAIIGYRGIKGYLEAWLRHWNYVQKFQELCQDYAYGKDEYKYYNRCSILDRSTSEACKHECRMFGDFKSDVIELIADRHTEFRENMSRRGKG